MMAFYHHADAGREMERECGDRERGRNPTTKTTWATITRKSRERDRAKAGKARGGGGE